MNIQVSPQRVLAECDGVLADLAQPNATHSLVTIHGIADSADVWHPVCRALDQRFNSYWQLGLKWHMGVGEAYDYPDCAEVLRQGWQQLPTGRKIVVVHSFGCNAFLKMIQEDAIADVDAAILLSPYYKPDYTSFSWKLFVQYVNEFERFLNSSIDARMGARAVSPKMRETILQHLLQSYSPPSWVMFFQTWSTTPALDLSKLNVPCKVMTGSEDFSLPVDDVRVLASKLRDADFEVLDGLGHFALIEDAGKTASRISSFLSERFQK